MFNKLALLLLPKQSPQRTFVKKVLIKLKLKNAHAGDYYSLWMDQQQLYAPLHQVPKHESGVKISIVVPVYNPNEHHFAELIYSVISQSYQNWELILSDASPSESAQKMVQSYANHDTRIKVYRNTNKGISLNTNYGLERATGNYIAFCDHDDTLAPFALDEVVAVIKEQNAEIIYSDEDKISDDSELYFDPHYKPDWSPDLLTHVNYINHLTVVKKALLDKVGYLDSSKDGAQDYDLMLRLTDTNPVIVHVPKVLYHWRATSGSTAQDFSSKTNITDAAKKALEEHFERKETPVNVSVIEDRPGFYELVFNAPKAVTIIIEPFASDAVLNLFVLVLLKKFKDSDPKIELILPYQPTLRHEEKKGVDIKVVALRNFFIDAVEQASNETVVVFSKPYLPETSSWLNHLTGILSQKHVAAVSPMVIEDNDTIRDCGLVRATEHTVIDLFRGQAAFNNQTIFGNTSWVRDVDGLNGGVAVVRKHEIEAFNKENKSPHNTIRAYTLGVSKVGEQYNVVDTLVIFRNYSMEPASPQPEQKTFFNKNIITSGMSGYILYSTEANLMGVLLRLIEQEGIIL